MWAPFGWCVVGPVTGESGTENIGCNVITITDSAAMFNPQTEEFFLNDILSVKPDVNSPVGAEEKNALVILEKETQFCDRRHVVGLHWQADNVQLPDDRSATQRRLQSSERKYEAITIYRAPMERGPKLPKWRTSSQAVLKFLPDAAASTHDQSPENLPVKRTTNLVRDFNQDAYLSHPKAPDARDHVPVLYPAEQSSELRLWLE